MAIKRYRTPADGNARVPCDAVSVLVAGGFLAESAPIALIPLARGVWKAALLLGHEQRGLLRDIWSDHDWGATALDTRYLADRWHVPVGLDDWHTEQPICWTFNADGEARPVEWSSASNLWLVIERAVPLFPRQFVQPDRRGRAITNGQLNLLALLHQAAERAGLAVPERLAMAGAVSEPGRT